MCIRDRFISHDIQTVRYISDDIIVMNGGKIVEQGEAKQVFQHLSLIHI